MWWKWTSTKWKKANVVEGATAHVLGIIVQTMGVKRDVRGPVVPVGRGLAMERGEGGEGRGRGRLAGCPGRKIGTGAESGERGDVGRKLR